MLFRILILATLMVFVAAVSGVCQSWDSAKPGVSTAVDVVFENGLYTWTFSNLSGTLGDRTTGYDVLAWSLQPFNVPAPIDVTVPDGWVWITSGGWSRFELSNNSSKFKTAGPALEPGESLVFTYKPAESGPVVNPGGPGPGIGFVTHIGAVKPETTGSRWIPTAVSGEDQWHEVVAAGEGFNMVPEPSGILAMLLGLGGLLGVSRRSTYR